MSSTRISSVELAVPVVLFLAATTAQAQSFAGLGLLPTGTSSAATAVSADGSVVVGSCVLPAGNRAFRWTSAAGMVSLGTLTGGTYSSASGVSHDGSVIVGVSNVPAGTRAVRWTSAGGMVNLGLPSDGGGDGAALNSFGDAVSGDGLVVVGMSDPINDGFRWTSAGGMLSLGTLGGSYSDARAANFDGSVVVGDATASDDNAFRWTLAGGMVSLGTLPGGTTSHASAVSRDGQVIVGYGGTSGFANIRAFRWVAGAGATGTMSNLGVLPGRNSSRAYGVSADGRSVVGISGTITAGDHAILWTPQLGMVDLNTYLPTLGMNLTGWTLTTATAISADGRTIIGNGTHGSTNEAWIAHLPCGSADFNGDGNLGTDQDIAAFFACLSGNCCPTCGSADFNSDGDLGTDADIESFFRVLAGGSC